MKGAFLLRQLLKPAATADKVTRTQKSCYGSITATEEESNRSKKNNFSNNNKGKWVTLPPYTSTINAVSLGKRITGRSATKEEVNDDLVETNPITALKWVLRCCPQLSRSLVQKLFRLRQVRRECSEVVLGVGAEAEECQLKRVIMSI